MQRWTNIFRVLANINRLKIIEMLTKNRKLNVTDISERLQISFKATSNHLAILKNAEVLEAQGTAGYVFYSLNPNMPSDFRKAIKIFLKPN